MGIQEAIGLEDTTLVADLFNVSAYTLVLGLFMNNQWYLCFLLFIFCRILTVKLLDFIRPILILIGLLLAGLLSLACRLRLLALSRSTLILLRIWSNHRCFRRFALFILVIEEQINDLLAVLNGPIAVELRIEQFDTEPDEFIAVVVAESQEAVNLDELLHRQSRLRVVSQDTERIEDDCPQPRLRRPQHLGIVDANLNGHAQVAIVLLRQLKKFVFLFALHQVVLCGGDVGPHGKKRTHLLIILASLAILMTQPDR